MNGRRPARIAVLGAGITGLAAAYEIVRRAQRERRRVEVALTTWLRGCRFVGSRQISQQRSGRSVA